MATVEQVEQALSTVNDPEIGQPITELGMVEHIEPRPGIPPAPAHVNNLIDRIQNKDIPLILIEPYFDVKLPEKIELSCVWFIADDLRKPLFDEGRVDERVVHVDIAQQAVVRIGIARVAR